MVQAEGRSIVQIPGEAPTSSKVLSHFDLDTLEAILDAAERKRDASGDAEIGLLHVLQAYDDILPATNNETSLYHVLLRLNLSPEKNWYRKLIDLYDASIASKKQRRQSKSISGWTHKHWEGDSTRPDHQFGSTRIHNQINVEPFDKRIPIGPFESSYSSPIHEIESRMRPDRASLRKHLTAWASTVVRHRELAVHINMRNVRADIFYETCTKQRFIHGWQRFCASRKATNQLLRLGIKFYFQRNANNFIAFWKLYIDHKRRLKRFEVSISISHCTYLVASTMNRWKIARFRIIKFVQMSIMEHNKSVLKSTFTNWKRAMSIVDEDRINIRRVVFKRWSRYYSSRKVPPLTNANQLSTLFCWLYVSYGFNIDDLTIRKGTGAHIKAFMKQQLRQCPIEWRRSHYRSLYTAHELCNRVTVVRTMRNWRLISYHDKRIRARVFKQFKHIICKLQQVRRDLVQIYTRIKRRPIFVQWKRLVHYQITYRHHLMLFIAMTNRSIMNHHLMRWRSIYQAIEYNRNHMQEIAWNQWMAQYHHFQYRYAIEQRIYRKHVYWQYVRGFKAMKQAYNRSRYECKQEMRGIRLYNNRLIIRIFNKWLIQLKYSHFRMKMQIVGERHCKNRVIEKYFHGWYHLLNDSTQYSIAIQHFKLRKWMYGMRGIKMWTNQHKYRKSSMIRAKEYRNNQIYKKKWMNWIQKLCIRRLKKKNQKIVHVFYRRTLVKRWYNRMNQENHMRNVHDKILKSRLKKIFKLFQQGIEIVKMDHHQMVAKLNRMIDKYTIDKYLGVWRMLYKVWKPLNNISMKHRIESLHQSMMQWIQAYRAIQLLYDRANSYEEEHSHNHMKLHTLKQWRIVWNRTASMKQGFYDIMHRRIYNVRMKYFEIWRNTYESHTNLWNRCIHYSNHRFYVHSMRSWLNEYRTVQHYKLISHLHHRNTLKSNWIVWKHQKKYIQRMKDGVKHVEKVIIRNQMYEWRCRSEYISSVQYFTYASQRILNHTTLYYSLGLWRYVVYIMRIEETLTLHRNRNVLMRMMRQWRYGYTMINIHSYQAHQLYIDAYRRQVYNLWKQLLYKRVHRSCVDAMNRRAIHVKQKCKYFKMWQQIQNQRVMCMKFIMKQWKYVKRRVFDEWLMIKCRNMRLRAIRIQTLYQGACGALYFWNRYTKTKRIEQMKYENVKSLHTNTCRRQAIVALQYNCRLMKMKRAAQRIIIIYQHLHLIIVPFLKLHINVVHCQYKRTLNDECRRYMKRRTLRTWYRRLMNRMEHILSYDHHRTLTYALHQWIAAYKLHSVYTRVLQRNMCNMRYNVYRTWRYEYIYVHHVHVRYMMRTLNRCWRVWKQSLDAIYYDRFYTMWAHNVYNSSIIKRVFHALCRAIRRRVQLRSIMRSIMMMRRYRYMNLWCDACALHKYVNHRMRYVYLNIWYRTYTHAVQYNTTVRHMTVYRITLIMNQWRLYVVHRVNKRNTYAKISQYIRHHSSCRIALHRVCIRYFSDNTPIYMREWSRIARASYTYTLIHTHRYIPNWNTTRLNLHFNEWYKTYENVCILRGYVVNNQRPRMLRNGLHAFRRICKGMRQYRIQNDRATLHCAYKLINKIWFEFTKILQLRVYNHRKKHLFTTQRVQLIVERVLRTWKYTCHISQQDRIAIHYDHMKVKMRCITIMRTQWIQAQRNRWILQRNIARASYELLVHYFRQWTVYTENRRRIACSMRIDELRQLFMAECFLSWRLYAHRRQVTRGKLNLSNKIASSSSYLDRVNLKCGA